MGNCTHQVVKIIAPHMYGVSPTRAYILCFDSEFEGLDAADVFSAILQSCEG
jgi:hypothetical protein